MNTRLGTYTLVNETRYDTDDLLAVANRVEEAASRAVGGAVPKLSRGSPESPRPCTSFTQRARWSRW
jgi:hypothetical protein